MDDNQEDIRRKYPHPWITETLLQKLSTFIATEDAQFC